MGIIWGLVAAAGWGSADFAARFSSRSIGAYRTLWYMQFIGLLALTLLLLFNGEFARLYNETSWQPWSWCVIAAVLGIGGALALYQSFAVGVISLVSPICASYAALTAALAIIGGERLNLLRGVGIVIVIVGVVLASTNFSRDEQAIEEVAKHGNRLPPGVGLALLAALCFGVSFWLLGYFVVPSLGGVAPIWVVRLSTVCLLPLLARPLRQNVSLPHGRIWWLILGIGVMDTVGNLGNTLGLASDQISVVSVLSSLFSAVTVLLAWIVLRERLALNQWLGIVIILVGVALVSMQVV